MLQNKELNIENLKASAITLKQHASNKNFTKKMTGNLAHESPQGNINSFVVFKNFTCFNSLIVKKIFLNLFKFHKKETRLHHLL